SPPPNKKSLEYIVKYLSCFITASFLCLALSMPLSAGEAIKADEALKLLTEGNGRFVDMRMRQPNVTSAQREDTALNGQEPFAAILACSDSRVPVETIFDRGIGDIFVVRVAGNIAADNTVMGSIEYAAKHLKVPLIVIMGHTECGAVTAAVKGTPLEGNIRDIQKEIEPVVAKIRSLHPTWSGDILIYDAIKNNTLQVKSDLLFRSQIIRGLVDSGKLKIVTAVYNVRNGQVEWGR
ncbi:MAG: carbonic anhydrase, partial [Candidatus Omnitrophota bacterium]